MNLKIEALKAIIFFALGGFIFVSYWPKPAPPKPLEAKQEQAQVCKAVLKKRTNPDGSVDEIAEFLASNSQGQSVKPQEPEIKKDKKYGVGLFPNELLAKYKVAKVDVLGKEFDVSVIGKAEKDNQKIGAMVEW